MANLPIQTRYERVLEILNLAAGESPADYGGHGRFWNLPLRQFLEVEIFGIRMIAKMTEENSATCSCCQSSAQSPDKLPADETEPAHPGLGAASGLIQGLRGEAPFDGSRFPRLPWGGETVAEQDIQFISDWIDDSCIEHDHEIGNYQLLDLSLELPVLEEVKSNNVELLAQETFNVYRGSPNEYKYQHGELKQRMNIDCMTDAQLDKLRAAFRKLYSLNKWAEDSRNYNNLALIHQNHCQHGWERFLPWHRIYMYEFEQALQDVEPDVTMPYWDWTMPQYHPARPENGWRIPKALQAYLTEKSLKDLAEATPSIPKNKMKKLEGMIGNHSYSQHNFFATVASLIGEEYTQGDYRKRFIDALLAANALWYPLRYPGEYQLNGKPSSINKVIHYHYPTADDIEQILSLRTFRDFGGGSLYNDSFGFLDQNPHNTMHIWTGGQNPDTLPNGTSQSKLGQDPYFDRNRGVQVAGRQFHSRTDLYSQPAMGDMFSNLTASYDPVFWPVHSNVDRLWWEWQQDHPHSVPADLDAVLTPWSYTIADTLDMFRFGYEYVKSTYIIPVGLAAPVGRIVSQPIEIPETVRHSFRQAEVRLHRVPQLARSCFIRVFLNLPDANANTEIRSEEYQHNYAGYLSIFGHGPCYGGPGHCDIPPSRARPYDQRPRHHNTPRNHRINVTKSAKQLLDNGATSLQITLVVIGADYEEDNDLLRLDGISLNFLD
jgi:tyrosinase